MADEDWFFDMDLHDAFVVKGNMAAMAYYDGSVVIAVHIPLGDRQIAKDFVENVRPRTWLNLMPDDELDRQ